MIKTLLTMSKAHTTTLINTSNQEMNNLIGKMLETTGATWIDHNVDNKWSLNKTKIRLR